MVNQRWLLALAMALLVGNAEAAGRCSQRTETEPGLCPVNVPAIERIVIKSNAQSLPVKEADPNDYCSDFIVNERTVRRFFTRAKLVAPGTSQHYELDWSPCYASGTMRFKDGRTANWELYRYRLGYIDMPGSKKPMQLYCIDCMRDDPGPLR